MERTKVTIYKDIHLSFLKPSRVCGLNYSDSSINSSFIVEGDRFLFVNRGNKESIFTIGLWIILTASEREAICLQTALRPQLVPVRKKGEFNHLYPAEVSTYLLQLFNIRTNKKASTV